MSQLSISKPLLLLLLLATVMTVIVLLRPETAVGSAETDLLAERPVPRAAARADDRTSPWHRALVPVVSGAAAGGLLPPALPVLPPPAPVEPVVYVPPPKPVAPTPGFTYLGRLESEEGTRIFLVVGDAFESVKQGDVIDNSWRIKRITDEGVELEYLPLHETRWLALTR